MTTTETNRLQFGLQPPDNAVRAWGARAIYNGDYIDIVWDRTDILKPTEDDTLTEPGQAFGKWIDTVAMPWLREHVKRTGYRNSDETHIAHVEGNRAICASARRSFGYLYIVAYELPEGEVTDEVETSIPAPKKLGVRVG